MSARPLSCGGRRPLPLTRARNWMLLLPKHQPPPHPSRRGFLASPTRPARSRYYHLHHHHHHTVVRHLPLSRPTTLTSHPPCLLSRLLLLRSAGSSSPHRPTATTITATVRMAAEQQSRSHGGGGGGHHHHHHRHHDNAYLTSSNRADAGVRITRIGLYSNLAMAVAKGIGGYVFHSHAMVADAWHSLTDLASDVLTLATVSWSLKPPSDAFPFGYGKIESLGSLGVSGMLLGGGVFMGWSSLETLYGHFFLDPSAAAELVSHGHHHHHHHGGGDGDGPSPHAAWLAAGTVAVKEWLYRATMKVARERKSTVLASNAVHHRVDSLTGIVTLLAILGANFVQNAAWLDPVGGLFISLLVIRAGLGNTLSALYELADRGIDDEFKQSVRRQALKGIVESGRSSVGGDGTGAGSGGDGAVDGVGIGRVSGTRSGQNYLVELELTMPRSWTIEDAAEVETAVRSRIGAKIRGARRVRIRFVPRGEDDGPAQFDEFIPPADASARSSPEPEDPEDHEEHAGHGHDHGASAKKHDKHQ